MLRYSEITEEKCEKVQTLLRSIETSLGRQFWKDQIQHWMEFGNWAASLTVHPLALSKPALSEYFTVFLFGENSLRKVSQGYL